MLTSTLKSVSLATIAAIAMSFMSGCETPAEGTQTATLYQFALKSLYQVLKQDFSFTETIPLKITTDFLASVSQENEIEETANSQCAI